MMWGRSKLKRNKQSAEQRISKLKKIYLAGGVFLAFILVAALALSPKVALANADDGLRAEVYKFKIAQKIKACRDVIKRASSLPFAYQIGGSVEYLTGVFGALDGYLPYDEGVIEPESRNRYLCDIRSFAEQNGQGDFFSKYFLEHGHISDDVYDSQVVLADKPNHTASNVKDKLRQNDLSGFYVSGALMDPAMVAYPSPQLSKGALAQMFREALRFCAKDPNNPFTEGEGKYRFVVKGDDGKYVVKKGYFTYAQGADDSRRVSVWASTHQHEPYAGPDKTCGILLHL